MKKGCPYIERAARDISIRSTLSNSKETKRASKGNVKGKLLLTFKPIQRIR
jgi:hypothetical protein